MAIEDIKLDEEQQSVYDAVWGQLSAPATAFEAPIPSIVSLADRLPEGPEELPITVNTPTRGHHALFRALEELEGLEKEEQTLLEHSKLTSQLMEIVMSTHFADSRQALQALEVAGKAVPRRVCQHPFKKNDIVWVCRTCQADETCVLCHACYSQSNHEGHDVAFYHAQAGGCCDCGDPDGTLLSRVNQSVHPSDTNKQTNNHSSTQPGIQPDFVRDTVHPPRVKQTKHRLDCPQD